MRLRPAATAAAAAAAAEPQVFGDVSSLFVPAIVLPAADDKLQALDGLVLESLVPAPAGDDQLLVPDIDLLALDSLGSALDAALLDLDGLLLAPPAVPAASLSPASQSPASSRGASPDPLGLDLLEPLGWSPVPSSPPGSPASRPYNPQTTYHTQFEWSEEVLQYTTPELNRFLRLNPLSPAEIKDLKLARRRRLNRAYAKAARQRRRRATSASSA